MSDKTDDPPPSPPDRFFSLRRIWAHMKQYRETYLFPFIGIGILYISIRLVNRLTGRAVVDDPGAIIGGLYNAVLIQFAIMIVGSIQGFLIPDVNESKPAVSWPKHLIDVSCTQLTFGLVLYYLFR